LTEEKVYECEECKKRGKDPEICCGKPMKEVSLDVCVSASSPEHSRPLEDEEPCDDSRSG
jgi:hypothetical protein